MAEASKSSVMKLLQLPVEKLQQRVDALPETEGQSADEDGDQQRAEKDLPGGNVSNPGYRSGPEG